MPIFQDMAVQPVQGGGHAVGLMPGQIGEPLPWLISCRDGGPSARAYAVRAAPKQDEAVKPSWTCQARRLAQGDLEAFVGGPVKGCLHEDGAIGQKPGKDISSRQYAAAAFAGQLQVTHYRRPFVHAIKWKLKPRQDPDRVPVLNIHIGQYVNRQPTSCIEDARTSYTGISRSWTPAVPIGRSNLARTRQVPAGNNKDALKKLDQLRAAGQLVSARTWPVITRARPIRSCPALKMRQIFGGHETALLG